MTGESFFLIMDDPMECKAVKPAYGGVAKWGEAVNDRGGLLTRHG